VSYKRLFKGLICIAILAILIPFVPLNPEKTAFAASCKSGPSIPNCDNKDYIAEDCNTDEQHLGAYINIYNSSSSFLGRLEPMRSVSCLSDWSYVAALGSGHYIFASVERLPPAPNNYYYEELWGSSFGYSNIIYDYIYNGNYITIRFCGAIDSYGNIVCVDR
jgi:hypothetical protein